MSQTWRRLTFLHWRYEPAVVRRLVAPELEIDTTDNAAWIGLVPFEIHGLRGIPHFAETNVRTYVVGPDGGRGVWFFSLDAARLAAVIGARIGYHLPYFWARMQVVSEDGTIRYRSSRKWPHARSERTDIVVEPGALFLPEELSGRDHFLTARYRLYTKVRGRLACAQIAHQPWTLARGTLREIDQTLLEAAGLPPAKGSPIVHYSDRLDVKIGYLRVC
jgi:uncharacterized protein YqjF (DUF2071 family)